MQSETISSCPTCQAENIDASIDCFHGVCTECGFVIHDATDTAAPDWITTETDPSQQEQADWMTECRVRNATEQQIAEAFGVIEQIADALGIGSELRKDAADTYCDAFCAETTDGRKTACLVAAAIRLASIQAGNPVPIDRMAETPSVDKKPLQLAYTALQQDLECSPETPEPIDYIPFLSNVLKLDESKREATKKLLHTLAGDNSVIGKNPAGIAAAAIYLTEEKLTQADVADAAGVSAETIRLRTGDIEEVASCDR